MIANGESTSQNTEILESYEQLGKRYYDSIQEYYSAACYSG